MIGKEHRAPAEGRELTRRQASSRPFAPIETPHCERRPGGLAGDRREKRRRRRSVRRKQDYGYAGLQSATATSGVRANLRVVKKPTVHAGHVAGWIGIGGTGMGPGGVAQWLQAGYSAFPDGSLQIYYEVTLPGKAPAYHLLKSKAAPGETHLISILEVSGKNGRWRVWLGSSAVSPAYYLEGSHGKYAPQGIGESWSPHSTACNTYDWLFDDLEVAMHPGGSWTRAKINYQWQDTGYQVKLIPPASFETASR
jgi:hypothetical protein